MMIRHFALTFGNVFSPCSQLLLPIEIRILLHLGSKQNKMGPLTLLSKWNEGTTSKSNHHKNIW